MGRGRAKAKQTRAAREIKYSSGNIDIDRLAAELAAERSGSGAPAAVEPEGDDEDDESYDAYAYDEDDED